MQKNVLTTNKSNNMFILTKSCLRVKKTKIMRRKKSFIMIILTSLPTQMTNLVAIMFGFIMYVRFGFLNVIFRKKMGLSMLKEYKISTKNDTNINVLYVKNLKLEPVLNVKIHNVESIIILNVQEKRKFTCNN